MLTLLPLMRNRRFHWWLFTYLIPILPLAFGWGCLRLLPALLQRKRIQRVEGWLGGFVLFLDEWPPERSPQHHSRDVLHREPFANLFANQPVSPPSRGENITRCELRESGSPYTTKSVRPAPAQVRNSMNSWNCGRRITGHKIAAVFSHTLRIGSGWRFI
jgi:hypothetical protein